MNGSLTGLDTGYSKTTIEGCHGRPQISGVVVAHVLACPQSVSFHAAESH